VTQQLIYKYALANVVILLMLLIFSCSGDTGDGNNAPTLQLVGIHKDTMVQGIAFEDSIVATINFEDIDGDIAGIDDDEIPFNIFIEDVRDGGGIDNVSFPLFPDLSKGQKGTMELIILTTCCINADGATCLPDTITSTNVFPYDIYIVDAQGNQSNTITTPLCYDHRVDDYIPIGSVVAKT